MPNPNRWLAAALLALVSLGSTGCALVFFGEGLVGLFCDEAAEKAGPCSCFLVCELQSNGTIGNCALGEGVFDLCYDGPFSTGDRAPRGASPPYAVPADAFFTLSSYAAGAATSHQVGFEVVGDVPETFHATVTYPPEFVFQGFAPGPVGELGLDFDRDGADDAAVPVIGLGGNQAFADVDQNGIPGAIDPLVVHSGDDVFDLSLPEGGDGNARTLRSVNPFRLRLTLFAGVLDNPPANGTYLLALDATSVDPDTDGADDAAGEAPQSLTAEEPVTIGDGICPPLPTAGCNATFETGSLALKDGPDAKDVLKLKGKRGRTATDFFGDPTDATSHATCLYDATGLLLELPVAAGGTGANGKPLWKQQRDRATYRDREAAAGGVQKVGQRSARKGAGFDVSARGPALALPALPLTPPVTVQHRTLDGGCAELHFEALTRNDAGAVKGRVR